MNVTIFKNIKSPKEPNVIPLSQALSRIKRGQSQEKIAEIRSGNKALKNELPVVCFSGEFSSREDGALRDHNGLLVLDFDHVNVDETKTKLAMDEHILACWESPSGDGVKALMRITNPERHRDHFRAAVDYIHKHMDLEVDETGINESRACYESYDPLIIIKDGARGFGAMRSEQAQPETETPAGLSTDYDKISIAARMIRKAVDGEKHDALRKAATLCGGYIAAGRMERTEVERILLREITAKDIESVEQAKRTIADAIEHGRQLPIRETLLNEKEAMREMRINDGDMSFISSDDQDFEWINSYGSGDIEVGLDTGCPKLDEYFRYKRELVVVNGHSNVGKTTFVLYLIANSVMRHGWKWVIYSSENRTATVKMNLMQFAVDRKIQDMTYMERKLAYEWVKEHFIVISNEAMYSYTDIIVFTEKILKQYDVDALFVDPYNSLRLQMNGAGLSSHEYHYEAASEFLTLSNTHNLAVWLNMHAVTDAQRKKGPDGLPIAPYAEDTEGGGKFVNRADCFLTIHRKVQALEHDIRKMTEFHVRKVREVETGGQPTPLDTPVKFVLNLSHTGFFNWYTRNGLFQPLDVDPSTQQQAMSFRIGSAADSD